MISLYNPTLRCFFKKIAAEFRMACKLMKMQESMKIKYPATLSRIREGSINSEQWKRYGRMKDGKRDKLSFIVYEYAKGYNFGNYIETAYFEEVVAHRFFVQLCLAEQFLHAQVLHSL